MYLAKKADETSATPKLAPKIQAKETAWDRIFCDGAGAK